MKSWILVVVAVLVATGMLGCNTFTSQPRFDEAVVSPPVLAPDSVGIITAHVSDPNNIITRVEGVVQEDDRINLTFRDDGAAPDEVPMTTSGPFKSRCPSRRHRVNSRW